MMKPNIQTRHLFLIGLGASVLLLIGCSYLTNFVVVNASDDSVKVRYRFKRATDPLAPRRSSTVPHVKAVSELNQEVPWREFSSSQYSFDPDSGTVVVSLEPGEALQLEVLNLTDKHYDASDFAIEEIDITGTHGEIKLEGEQVYKGFVVESKKLLAVTYR